MKFDFHQKIETRKVTQEKLLLYLVSASFSAVDLPRSSCLCLHAAHSTFVCWRSYQLSSSLPVRWLTAIRIHFSRSVLMCELALWYIRIEVSHKTILRHSLFSGYRFPPENQYPKTAILQPNHIIISF